MADEGVGSVPAGNGAAAADWRPFLTDELKADPIVSKWAEKASEKDIPSILKTQAHLSSRMGSAISLPGKDAKPEEIQALRAKLYEAGVFQAPPGTPEEYGITKGDLPEGLGWNDENAKALATVLHKHGVPKAAAAELLALHHQSLVNALPSLKVNREESLAKLKAEHGEKYEERVEMVKRMMNGIVKDPQELAILESSGLADHPGFLSVLLRLAPLAMQDSSFTESLASSGGSATGQQAREELVKIQTDQAHPMHLGYKQNDPKVMEHILDLYRKAYPGNVELG